MIPLQILLDATWFLAAHLASLTVIGGSAWIFGETLFRRLSLGRTADRWALAGALGWGLVLQALGVLGLLDLLERWIVLALLALGHLACTGTWRSVVTGVRRHGRAVALAALVSAPFVAVTLYPPTGFDATVYHLPYARAFVDAGGLDFLPDLRFPVFPQIGEMGFVLGFFLSGEVAAKLTQLLAFLLTAGLLLDWGRLWDRRAGIWAAALWLGNPLAVWLGASAYVDATLALFVAASFLCWQRWEGDGDRRWLWLAGAFAGLAAGTKYLGLFFLAALAAMAAIRSLADRGGRPGGRLAGAGPLLTLTAVALAVLAPWYLRIVYHTGSPVFPFYAPIFGASEWASMHDQALPAGDSGTAAALLAVAESQLSRVVEGLPFLAAVPWTAVFDRGVFHWQAPLSPWYLVLLPLAAPLALCERRARRLLAVAAVYALFWLTTVRDLRFLLAVMPALDVALAAALAGATLPVRFRATFERRTRRLPRGPAAALLTALLLAPGVLYAGHKLREQGWPPIDAAGRDAYLARQVHGYLAIETIDRLAGREYTVYALYGENLRYYADGRFLGDRFGPARYAHVEAVLYDPRALHDRLAGWGACYFLLRHPRAVERLSADPELRRLFVERFSGDGVTLFRLPAVPCSREPP